MQHYLVPAQQQGNRKDLEVSVIADLQEDAEDWFVDAKDRLLSVNNWKKYLPADAHGFNLTDAHGRMMNRNAHPHDHIRIDTPGPGPREINAHDWVVIEAIEYDDYPDDNKETFALNIKAAGDPDNKTYEPASIASGTLVIERNGKKLSACYHGRNNVPMDGVQEWMGISADQWTALLRGFIE